MSPSSSVSRPFDGDGTGKKCMLTRDIKKHIRKTQEIVRITNVMYLLAASRMARVRRLREQARCYFREMGRLLALAHAHLKKQDLSLLTPRPARTLWYVVITPDQGFCGGLPSTINRWATTCAQEQQKRMAQQAGGKLPTIGYLTVGKKGSDYLKRTNQHLVQVFPHTELTWAFALQITQVILEAFDKEAVDAVFLVYAKPDRETPQLVVEQLVPLSFLPGSLGEATGQEAVTAVTAATETPRRLDAYTFFVPKVERIFPQLVFHFLVSHIYVALLEGAMSEYTARMVAMKQATTKAREALEDLTRAYNTARQAQITNELLEITSAAEALREQLFP
jgi:F-type H+-transporting ATPase subunit gamma